MALDVILAGLDTRTAVGKVLKTHYLQLVNSKGGHKACNITQRGLARTIATLQIMCERQHVQALMEDENYDADFHLRQTTVLTRTLKIFQDGAKIEDADAVPDTAAEDLHQWMDEQFGEKRHRVRLVK